MGDGAEGHHPFPRAPGRVSSIARSCPSPITTSERSGSAAASVANASGAIRNPFCGSRRADPQDAAALGNSGRRGPGERLDVAPVGDDRTSPSNRFDTKVAAARDTATRTRSFFQAGRRSGAADPRSRDRSA